MEQENQSASLTQELKALTTKAMRSISEDMQSQDAIFKNAKHYKDIAGALEKFSNVVTKLSVMEEKEMPPEKSNIMDNCTAREKREIIEGARYYYEGHKEQIHDIIAFLKEKEEQEEAEYQEECRVVREHEEEMIRKFGYLRRPAHEIEEEKRALAAQQEQIVSEEEPEEETKEESQNFEEKNLEKKVKNKKTPDDEEESPFRIRFL